MKRKAALFFVLLATGCRGCSCGDATIDVQPLAEVIAHCGLATGDVRRRPASATAWDPLAVGADLMSGDWVQTAQNALARIDFEGGTELAIGPSSVVVIEPPSAQDGGELLAGRISVRSGSVRGIVKGAGSRRTLMVGTPDGKKIRLASEPGSKPVDYRLTVAESGVMELMVADGRATVVTQDGKETQLEAGQAMDLEAGTAKGEVFELPKRPTLSGPPEGIAVGPAKNGVQLSWEATEHAIGYQIEIAEDPSFTQGVVRRDVDQPSFELKPAKAGEYYWRVAGRSESGRLGAFSASRRLSVTDQAISDRLVKPRAGAVFAFEKTPPVIAFAWESLSDSETYRLVVAKGPTLGDDPEISESVSGTSFDTSALPVGDYVWGVYAQQKERRFPLFQKPRKLSVRKERTGLRVPKSLKWGTTPKRR